MIIFFVGADPKGLQFYSYIHTTYEKVQNYMLKFQEGTVLPLGNLGHIIVGGEGTEPSKELKQYMEIHYQVDHNFMAHLLAGYQQTQNAINVMAKMGHAKKDYAAENLRKSLFFKKNEKK